MRYAIIADIHSNLEALKAVLEDIKAVNQIWSLGDTVGYGPNPNECVELVKEHAKLNILGNHDLGALGKEDVNLFNENARWAVEWTKEQLNKKSKDYIKGLGLVVDATPQIFLAHGSPRDPIWEYLTDEFKIAENFNYFQRNICFVGHTHSPYIAQKVEDGAQYIDMNPGETIKLDKKSHYIINPGSVGQPRDNDPRASYMILDDSDFSIEYHRLEYPIEMVQERMRTLNFPIFLVERLERGI